ncbi:hypothetical protein TNCV_5098641 [Trichonephila clavipes]|uniref:Uncharacterized protein n=1 Tax=Trichonephila clavipes TaxID=2585209 RepID=A0A8X6VBN5_TRICX|nr:hypothetical protein TNCV_5098641 [Trichonephila clavipes]
MLRLKSLPVGEMEVRRGECQLRCRLSHLTTVQNDEKYLHPLLPLTFLPFLHLVSTHCNILATSDVFSGTDIHKQKCRPRVHNVGNVDGAFLDILLVRTVSGNASRSGVSPRNPFHPRFGGNPMSHTRAKK